MQGLRCSLCKFYVELTWLKLDSTLSDCDYDCSMYVYVASRDVINFVSVRQNE